MIENVPDLLSGSVFEPDHQLSGLPVRGSSFQFPGPCPITDLGRCPGCSLMTCVRPGLAAAHRLRAAARCSCDAPAHPAAPGLARRRDGSTDRAGRSRSWHHRRMR